MKHFSIIALGTVALMSACNSRPTNQFDLHGTIDGADGQTVYLRYSIGDSVVVDSALVTNGAFAFNGEIETPVNAILYSGPMQMGNNAITNVYLEPSEMTVAGLLAGDYSAAKVTGSQTQAEADEYNAVAKAIEKRALEIRQSPRPEDPAEMKALGLELDSLIKTYKQLAWDFINNHPDSYFSADLLSQQLVETDFDTLKKTYNSLTPRVQAHAPKVAKEIASVEAVQPGKPAPDLIGLNPEGKEIKLSDLKGKVVLIDFWATWCEPCRAAMPHVKDLYNKYHDKGFEVFCVADNDSNPDEWKEAVASEGIDGFYNILRGLKTIKDTNGRTVDFDRSNDQSEKYAVHLLPTKYLIAADGTIIGKMGPNEELEAKLAEIFGE